MCVVVVLTLSRTPYTPVYKTLSSLYVTRAPVNATASDQTGHGTLTRYHALTVEPMSTRDRCLPVRQQASHTRGQHSDTPRLHCDVNRCPQRRLRSMPAQLDQCHGRHFGQRLRMHCGLQYTPQLGRLLLRVRPRHVQGADGRGQLRRMSSTLAHAAPRQLGAHSLHVQRRLRGGAGRHVCR